MREESHSAFDKELVRSRQARARAFWGHTRDKVMTEFSAAVHTNDPPHNCTKIRL